MNEERKAVIRERLRRIREDAQRDASLLDGQPFSGRVVATEFGYLLAMVDALAHVIDAILEEGL